MIVAAAFAAAFWWVSRPDPTRVIIEAQTHLAAERFFRAETEFALDGVFDRPELSFGDARIALTGSVTTDADRTDPAAMASASTFAFSLGAGEDTLVMDGEARKKDHLHYLRLEEVSDALFPGIGDLADVWMRSDAPFLDYLVQPLEEGLILSDLGLEGYDEIHAALGVVALFRYHDTLPSETIDGEKTFHYAVTLRQDVAAAIMTRIREFRTGVPSRPEDYALELAKVMSWGEAVGEVWIGKKDRRFRRIRLSSLLSEPTGGAKLDLDLHFSRYGVVVEVDVPEARDADALLGRVFSGRLDLAGDRTLAAGEPPAAESLQVEVSEPAPEPDIAMRDADSDGDGITDSEEFIYGSDPWNPDTDGDGWSDGTEILNGKNPVGPGALFGFGL